MVQLDSHVWLYAVVHFCDYRQASLSSLAVYPTTDTRNENIYAREFILVDLVRAPSQLLRDQTTCHLFYSIA